MTIHDLHRDGWQIFHDGEGWQVRRRGVLCALTETELDAVKWLEKGAISGGEGRQD